MKIIIKKKPADPQAIHKNLQKGYRIKHPEKICGYNSFFMNYGDIIVSDRIAFRMDHSEEFRNCIFVWLHEFQNDKYGLISHNDYDCNMEDKWISDGGDLFSRYAYSWKTIGDKTAPEEFIKIRKYKDNTYILYDSEPDWIIKEYLSE